MDTRLNIRCSRHQKEAMEEVADYWNCTVSELVRGQMMDLVGDEDKPHYDAIPDSVRAAAMVRTIKDDAQPFQQAMHLPNNLWEETRNLLTKKWPPHPEDVHKWYYQPYVETLQEVYGSENMARYLRLVGQLNHVMKRYKQLHYDTSNPDSEESVNAVIDFAMSVKVEEDMDEAKAFIKQMVNDGVLPDRHRDLVFDKVREMHRNEWQDDWVRATGNQPPQEEVN